MTSSSPILSSTLDHTAMFRHWINKHTDPNYPINQTTTFALLLKNNITSPSIFGDIAHRDNNDKLRQMGFVPGIRVALFKIRENSFQHPYAEFPNYTPEDCFEYGIELSMKINVLQIALDVFDRIPSSLVRLPTTIAKSQDEIWFYGDLCTICCWRDSQTVPKPTNNLLLKKVRIISNPAVFQHQKLKSEDYNSPSNFVHLCSWCSERFEKFEIASVPSFFSDDRAYIVTHLLLPENVYEDVEDSPFPSSSPSLFPPLLTSTTRTLFEPVKTILDNRGQFHSPIPIPHSSACYCCPYCSMFTGDLGSVISHYFFCSKFNEHLLEVGITNIAEHSKRCPYCQKKLKGGKKAIGRHCPRCPRFLYFVECAERMQPEMFESTQPTPRRRAAKLHERIVDVHRLSSSELAKCRSFLLRIRASFCFFRNKVPCVFSSSAPLTHVIEQVQCSNDLSCSCDQKEGIFWPSPGEEDDKIYEEIEKFRLEGNNNNSSVHRDYYDDVDDDDYDDEYY